MTTIAPRTLQSFGEPGLDRPTARRLTAAQLEAGRRRPTGAPEERARIVRAILDAPTFSGEFDAADCSACGS